MVPQAREFPGAQTSANSTGRVGQYQRPHAELGEDPDRKSDGRQRVSFVIVGPPFKRHGRCAPQVTQHNFASVTAHLNRWKTAQPSKGNFRLNFIRDTASEKPLPRMNARLGRSEESFRNLSAVIWGSERPWSTLKLLICFVFVLILFLR
jgi:hypothetical protein